MPGPFSLAAAKGLLSLKRFVAFLFLAIEVLVAPLIFVALLAPSVGLVLALLVEARALDTLPLEVVTFETLLFLLSGKGLLKSLLFKSLLFELLLLKSLRFLLLSVPVLLLLALVVVVICSGTVGQKNCQQGNRSRRVHTRT